MLRMNDIYTWKEITKEYPDLWVIITNVKEQNGEIETCKLMDVCHADERAIYVKKYLNLGVRFRCVRTTFSAPNVGILS